MSGTPAATNSAPAGSVSTATAPAARASAAKRAPCVLAPAAATKRSPARTPTVLSAMPCAAGPSTRRSPPTCAAMSARSGRRRPTAFRHAAAAGIRSSQVPLAPPRATVVLTPRRYQTRRWPPPQPRSGSPGVVDRPAGVHGDLPCVPVRVDEHAGVSAPLGHGSGPRDACPAPRRRPAWHRPRHECDVVREGHTAHPPLSTVPNPPPVRRDHSPTTRPPLDRSDLSSTEDACAPSRALDRSGSSGRDPPLRA
jgi:hypothetical protein